MSGTNGQYYSQGLPGAPGQQLQPGQLQIPQLPIAPLSNVSLPPNAANSSMQQPHLQAQPQTQAAQHKLHAPVQAPPGFPYHVQQNSNYSHLLLQQQQQQQQHLNMQAAARPTPAAMLHHQHQHQHQMAMAQQQHQQHQQQAGQHFQQPPTKRQRGTGLPPPPSLLATMQQPQQPSQPFDMVAAQAQARLRSQLSDRQLTLSQRLAQQFPHIELHPKEAEDKEVLPQTRIPALLATTCGPGIKTTPEAEAAIKGLAREYVNGAVSFALAMARRRGGGGGADVELQATDVALYMRQIWGVDVPGVGRGHVGPYRRLAGSEEHRSRMKAVRRGNGGAFLKAIPADKKRESSAAVSKRRGRQPRPRQQQDKPDQPASSQQHEQTQEQEQEQEEKAAQLEEGLQIDLEEDDLTAALAAAIAEDFENGAAAGGVGGGMDVEEREEEEEEEGDDDEQTQNDVVARSPGGRGGAANGGGEGGDDEDEEDEMEGEGEEDEDDQMDGGGEDDEDE